MKYRAIIADPPWQYGSPRAMPAVEKRDGTRALSTSVDERYLTMPLSEIKALRVPAADDCLLFLWTTNAFLCDGSASEVVKAWGFTPKSVLTWAKVQADGKTPSMKTGHWFRSASEHVIFAVKGKVPRSDSWAAVPTWFPHKRLPHSVKPDTIHELAEMACPEGPWLEMFARRQVPGWDAWGNEAPSSITLDSSEKRSS